MPNLRHLQLHHMSTKTVPPVSIGLFQNNHHLSYVTITHPLTLNQLPFVFRHYPATHLTFFSISINPTDTTLLQLNPTSLSVLNQLQHSTFDTLSIIEDASYGGKPIRGNYYLALDPLDNVSWLKTSFHLHSDWTTHIRTHLQLRALSLSIAKSQKDDNSDGVSEFDEFVEVVKAGVGSLTALEIPLAFADTNPERWDALGQLGAQFQVELERVVSIEPSGAASWDGRAPELGVDKIMEDGSEEVDR